MKSLRNIHLFGFMFVMLFSMTISERLSAQNRSPFSLISSSPSHVVVRFEGEDFHFVSQITSRGKTQSVVTINGIPNLGKGVPDLPQYATSLRLPFGTRMIVKVVSVSYHDRGNILITPSRGVIYRNVQRDSFPFVFGKVYGKDTFYPDRVWDVRVPYVLRQNHGQTLIIYPFRYNPAKRVLRIYSEIVLDITFQRDAKEESSVLSSPESVNQAGFENIVLHHFLNYSSSLKMRQKLPLSMLRMLIISYGPFIPLLKDFIVWKQKTGIHVQVVDVASIGDSHAIKSYIRDAYRNSGLMYVLLVGDAPQVPGSRLAGNDSDNDYAYVDGNDHYPDLFVGRLSAETPEQLTVMLNRTMTYEKALSADTGFYTHLIGIGSEMGAGYHNFTDYQQIRFIDSAYLLSSVYWQATELFDGSHGGLDADGNPSGEMLTEAINKGAGVINYCGHGSTTGWNTTDFTDSQVNMLQNTEGWPFIISVSCATGNFVHQDCFAESWLRASQNGHPTGAVALLMPTIDQSWDPPMCGQQQINALVAAPDSVHSPRTFAAICMEGCMKMNDKFGTDGYEITDTWTVFGDPSLKIRTAVPKEIKADYPVFVNDTCTSIRIKTNLHYGRVTLFANGIIYAIADIDSLGNAFLAVDSVPESREVDLTITAFNHRPLLGKLLWGSASDLKVNGKSLFGFKIFPNPAISKVSLSFALKKSRKVEITVFDVNGKGKATLYSGELAQGKHQVNWQSESPGVYFIQLKTSAQSIRKKIIILR